ncbi:hypothetical protein Poly30_56900 [Planctomycetes bacterium Poly30]|uniref:Uncharacterized protein n=1 Tax=Saltatorellus ferox TaxID=2528018 RepID=A0A518F1B1_9BACT|nr:hypothetical protein Poly30_56900 [Planctomycetes bacterium Poly30]
MKSYIANAERLGYKFHLHINGGEKNVAAPLLKLIKDKGGEVFDTGRPWR